MYTINLFEAEVVVFLNHDSSTAVLNAFHEFFHKWRVQKVKSSIFDTNCDTV